MGGMGAGHGASGMSIWPSNTVVAGPVMKTESASWPLQAMVSSRRAFAHAHARIEQPQVNARRHGGAGARAAGQGFASPALEHAQAHMAAARAPAKPGVHPLREARMALDERAGSATGRRPHPAPAARRGLPMDTTATKTVAGCACPSSVRGHFALNPGDGAPGPRHRNGTRAGRTRAAHVHRHAAIGRELRAITPESVCTRMVRSVRSPCRAHSGQSSGAVAALFTPRRRRRCGWRIQSRCLGGERGAP